MLSQILIRLFELFVIVGALSVVFIIWLYRKHSAEIERNYLERSYKALPDSPKL